MKKKGFQEPDKYTSFEELIKSEKNNKDYKICFQQKDSEILFLAPHGGVIEPGTSEIAKALAGDQFSYYTFESLKKPGNIDLHITSSHFNEPQALEMASKSKVVVTVHGYGWDENGECIMVGGLDNDLAKKIKIKFKKVGYEVKSSVKMFNGTSPRNICNHGRSKQGIQLEINLILRKNLIKNKDKMKVFVDAVHLALE